jgi:hypothetical protein
VWRAPGHGAHHTRLNVRYAWPSAEWGSLPIEGGVEAAYRREIEAAPDPDALRAELEAAPGVAAIADADCRGLRHRGDSSTRATRARCSSTGSRRAYEIVCTERGPKTRGLRP